MPWASSGYALILPSTTWLDTIRSTLPIVATVQLLQLLLRTNVSACLKLFRSNGHHVHSHSNDGRITTSEPHNRHQFVYIVHAYLPLNRLQPTPLHQKLQELADSSDAFTWSYSKLNQIIKITHRRAWSPIWRNHVRSWTGLSTWRVGMLLPIRNIDQRVKMPRTYLLENYNPLEL